MSRGNGGDASGDDSRARAAESARGVDAKAFWDDAFGNRASSAGTGIARATAPGVARGNPRGGADDVDALFSRKPSRLRRDSSEELALMSNLRLTAASTATAGDATGSGRARAAEGRRGRLVAEQLKSSGRGPTLVSLYGVL